MLTMSHRAIALAASLVLGACTAVPAPEARTERVLGRAALLRSRLQQTLDSMMRDARVPGISVGVAFPDGSSLGIASGLADTTRRVALTPSHRLLQGSVGKTYVAAVALQLVTEGRLRLDAPIREYLGAEPWFSRLPNARQITVRHLMNHTSGLVRYEFKPEFTRDLTANPQKEWKPEEQVAYLLDSEAAFAPGAGWDYSDTNYIVLGMIIERITGRRYYDEMRARLLQRPGLRETVPSDRALIPMLAQGYAGANNPFGGKPEMLDSTGRMIINPQFEWTGGGIASTTRDLARWAQLLYSGQVLDAAMMREMLTGVPARLGPNTQYGLGVIIRNSALGLSHGHSGFFPGYSTEMMYFPADSIAVAVQINSSDQRALNPPPGRVLGAIVRAVRAP